MVSKTAHSKHILSDIFRVEIFTTRLKHLFENIVVFVKLEFIGVFWFLLFSSAYKGEHESLQ